MRRGHAHTLALFAQVCIVFGSITMIISAPFLLLPGTSQFANCAGLQYEVSIERLPEHLRCSIPLTVNRLAELCVHLSRTLFLSGLLM